MIGQGGTEQVNRKIRDSRISVWLDSIRKDLSRLALVNALSCAIE